MCGIFGFLNNTDKEVPQSNLHKLFEKISHRGPDVSTFKKINKQVSLGFHRLSINGLDEKSNQPLQLNDCFLVCNGEIFNHKKLEDVYDVKPVSNSDCEIILHLYLKGGIRFVLNNLEGEFAFLLYDKKRHILVAARDHIGVRPLFFGYDKDGIMFASEARCLIDNYKNVKQFMPGCYMTSFDIGHYVNYINHIYINPRFKKHSWDRALEIIRNLFIQSVKERVMSDRPFGAFLSGGLDSSLVVAVLKKLGYDVPVFTIGLEGSPDIKAAKEVVKFLGLTKHHVVTYSVEEGISKIPDVIESLESYDITTIRASTPQWMLSEYINKNTDIKVLFSGECIDEICGYYMFAFCDNDKQFNRYAIEMVRDLHLYDLLRTDRTTAAHGLEVRVPFAAKNFINYILNINTSFKRFGKDEIEKKILREAFKGYLPDSILWRKKHAFSDSVSNQKTSWYGEVAKHAKKTIDMERWEKRKSLYPHSTPVSEESFWYREEFEKRFPGKSSLIPRFWMPKGIETDDPSATVLDGFKLDK